MLIPLFGDTGGSGLKKSNFWFSLLYLNILINELSFPIKDVVMVGESQSLYFTNLINESVSFNILICDDGSYTGQQIDFKVLPKVFNEFIVNKTNRIHFCFPFCSKICQEKNDEYFRIRDRIKELLIQKQFFAESLGINLGIRDLHNQNLKWKKNFIKNQLLNDTDFIDLFENLIDVRVRNWKQEFKKHEYFNLLEDILSNLQKQYFGDFIKFHVGDINFNKEMNHWFDHKLPDKYSLIPPHRPPSTIQIKTPYKNKKWVVHGKEFNKENAIQYHINPNLLLFNPDDQSTPVSSQQIELDPYSGEIDPTGKLSGYILHYKNLEKEKIHLLNKYGEFPIDLYP